MTLILDNEIKNNTPADAIPVDNNYKKITAYINSDVINADGSVAMKNPLHLVAADPVGDNDATRKSYVDALLPVGVIMAYGGQAAPAGRWALCNGAALASATYPKLYAVIGTRYGAGTTGTFKLPNLVGRFPIGMDATQAEFNATGKSGGSFTVPVPAHVHAMPHGHPVAHTHEHPHTHPINHDHGSVNSAAPTASHRHDMSLRQNSTPGTTGSYMMASSTGTTVAGFTGYDADSHVHAVNLPSFAGTSGAVSEATTGTSSIANTGQPTITNTSSTGVANVELQPPFVVINYIIRLD